MSGTVLFGPFVGELGWEMLYWQGWVRKVSRGAFRDWRKIAASRPGREPFYPDVDEFWPLPDYFLALRPSAHAYLTDGWRRGYPGRQSRYYVGLGLRRWQRLGHWEHQVWLPRPLRRVIFDYKVLARESPLHGPDVEPVARRVLADFRARLPHDALSFVPWQLNRYEADGVEFGADVLDADARRPRFVFKALGYGVQLFERLGPTPDARRACEAVVPPDKRLLAVFPRWRTVRRSDKNWPAGSYVHLIRRLQDAFPDLTIGIFGEPGGAYFADGVPGGCADFINVPERQRLDIQIAALGRSVLALGSMSGVLAVALAAGCPALIWGHPEMLDVYHRANVLDTPLLYHPDNSPSVDVVFGLARSLLFSTGACAVARDTAP